MFKCFTDEETAAWEGYRACPGCVVGWLEAKLSLQPAACPPSHHADVPLVTMYLLKDHKVAQGLLVGMSYETGTELDVFQILPSEFVSRPQQPLAVPLLCTEHPHPSQDPMTPLPLGSEGS